MSRNGVGNCFAMFGFDPRHILFSGEYERQQSSLPEQTREQLVMTGEELA